LLILKITGMEDNTTIDDNRLFPNCSYSQVYTNSSEYFFKSVVTSLCTDDTYLSLWTFFRIFFIIIFSIVLIWSVLGFVTTFIRRKPKNLWFWVNTSAMLSLLSRVLFMIDPWAVGNIIVLSVNTFLYWQAFTYWILSSFILIGVWFEILNTRLTKANMNFKRSKYAALIIAGVWGLLSFVLGLIVSIVSIHAALVILNGLLAIFLLAVCILLPFFGIKLLNKLQMDNSKRTIKRIRYFLYLTPIPSSLGLLGYVIYLVLRERLVITAYPYIVFHFFFRLCEDLSLAGIVYMAVGTPKELIESYMPGKDMSLTQAKDTTVSMKSNVNDG